MKYSCCFLVFLLVFSGALAAQAQSKTIQEKLGYPKDARLLIIHADDLGVSHSENRATIRAMQEGCVNSGSIMVPCPWFPEIAAYARENPQADLGLHLTLTAEWKLYKWDPVAPAADVPGLTDEQGFMYPSVEAVAQNATAEEVERELRAQIERAKAFGIDPTHFDTHMGAVFARPEFLQVYLKLGREYQVPVLLPRLPEGDPRAALLGGALTEKDVVLDQLHMAMPPDYAQGMAAFYTKVLNNLEPGLNCLLLHAAHDDAEMQAVTVDHPDFGSAWRQADFEFFSSEACQQILREQKIQLVTWRELRDKVVRKER